MQIYTKPGTSPCLLSKKCCPAVFKRRDICRDFCLIFGLAAIVSVAGWVESAGEWPIKGEKRGISQWRYTPQMMVDMLPKGEHSFANGATDACTRWGRCRLKVRPQASLYRNFRS